MPKHETNAQRRARENRRGKILERAKEIAGAIRTRMEASSAQESQLFEYFEKLMRIASSRSDDKSPKVETIEDIAESLRLAADILEEKPLDGRNLNWYDDKILAAFLEAAARAWRDPHRVNPCYEDEILRITTAQPTFSEFLEVFRQQNPKVKVEDSSLRRSLKRLGASTLPEKRGRRLKEK
jgi:hypothetical protein